MSEVIENFIRRNPGLSEEEAFDGFLGEDRIRAWVGSDPARRERLQQEFGRVWGSLHAPATTARSGPSGPVVQTARPVRVEVAEAPPAPVAAAPPPPAPTLAPPPPPPSASAGPARRLQVMCTACARVNVWMGASGIGCRSCGRVYDDMLQLIRVTPVGPFAFLFGEGWRGAATAGGILVGLAGLYWLLRGF